MRWKLVLLASLIAALLSVAVWGTLAIGAFGSARELARHDWIFLGSGLIPVIFFVFAGVFTYRHTARRRKTQAILSAILTAILTVATYFFIASTFPQYFSVPRIYKLPHTR